MVREIKFNRPEKLNCLDIKALADLKSALEQAAEDPTVHVVTIRGTGRAFCTGQDLTEPAFLAAGGVEMLLRDYYEPIILSIEQMPKPVVALVNGIAAGGGANLALACDVVLAARSASFSQPFVQLGLTVDVGGSYHLRRRVGLARSLGLALLSGSLEAERAAQWGLIWACVDDDALESELQVIVSGLTLRSAQSLAATKLLIRARFDDSASRLVAERAAQVSLAKSAYVTERVRAFTRR